jgi:O-antigen/teichoic acid export membrane protein
VLAFVLALGMVALSVLLVVLFWKAGRKLWRVFFSAGSEGAAVP